MWRRSWLWILLGIIVILSVLLAVHFLPSSPSLPQHARPAKPDTGQHERAPKTSDESEVVSGLRSDNARLRHQVYTLTVLNKALSERVDRLEQQAQRPSDVANSDETSTLRSQPSKPSLNWVAHTRGATITLGSVGPPYNGLSDISQDPLFPWMLEMSRRWWWILEVDNRHGSQPFSMDSSSGNVALVTLGGRQLTNIDPYWAVKHIKDM